MTSQFFGISIMHSKAYLALRKSEASVCRDEPVSRQLLLTRSAWGLLTDSQ